MSNELNDKLKHYILKTTEEITREEEESGYFAYDHVEKVYRLFKGTEINIESCVDVIYKSNGRLSIKGYDLHALKDRLEFILYSFEQRQIKEENDVSKKVFISHSSLDKKYGGALVSLLRGIGLSLEQIIYTSDSDYGIPLHEDIYDYLKGQIKNDVHIIYLLSDNYYSSTACLNEMGAAWIVQNEYTSVYLPSFNVNGHQFQNGAINPRKMGLYINDKKRLIEFKNFIIREFDIAIDERDWNNILDEYLLRIEGLS